MMRSERSREIRAILEGTASANRLDTLLCQKNCGRNDSPSIKQLTPATQWTDYQLKRKIMEAQLEAKFKEQHGGNQCLHKLKSLQNSFAKSKQFPSGSSTQRSRINFQTRAKTEKRIGLLFDDLGTERDSLKNLTLHRNQTKMDQVCSKLDRKMERTFLKTRLNRDFYTIVKPFDFLNHPKSKVDELHKTFLGHTYNFTQTRACPHSTTDPSTRKLKENLKALECKFATCSIT